MRQCHLKYWLRQCIYTSTLATLKVDEYTQEKTMFQQENAADQSKNEAFQQENAVV
jgi:FtsZ-binding cell division protein ZapB